MGQLKRLLLGSVFMLNGLGIALAQDTIPEEPAGKTPEKAPFESGYFIADQTVVMPVARTLELVLQHDFGTFQQKWSDLWGIWGASNIRIGFNYTITQNLQVGFGTTKNKRMQDFNLKYVIKRQEKGGFPVTLSVFGNVTIDGRNKSQLGNNKLPGSLDFNSIVQDPEFRNSIAGQLHENDSLFALDYLTYNQATALKGANTTDLNALHDQTFKSAYRFSYYAELMIARRFCKEFSAQLGISWVHYNLVDQNEMFNNHANGMYNDNLNIAGIGRLKVSPQSSLMLSYSQPVFTYLNTAPWPNFGLGWEVSTSTHCFQVFVTSANGLVPQETVMYNYNNPYNGFILFGFNITRLWTF